MVNIRRPEPQILVVSEPRLGAGIRLAIWLGTVSVYYFVLLTRPETFTANAGLHEWVLLLVPLILLPYLLNALRVLRGAHTLIFDGRAQSVACGGRRVLAFDEVDALDLSTIHGTCEEFRLSAKLTDGRRLTLLESRASAEMNALAEEIASLVGIGLNRAA